MKGEFSMTEPTKRKTKAEQIEGIEQQLEQLQNRKKLLIKQHKEDERKARNRRLYQRHGLFESLLPDTIGLTDEQFNTFLHRTVANDYGRDKLAEIIAEGEMADKRISPELPMSNKQIPPEPSTPNNQTSSKQISSESPTPKTNHATATHPQTNKNNGTGNNLVTPQAFAVYNNQQTSAGYLEYRQLG